MRRTRHSAATKPWSTEPKESCSTQETIRQQQRKSAAHLTALAPGDRSTRPCVRIADAILVLVAMAALLAGCGDGRHCRFPLAPGPEPRLADAASDSHPDRKCRAGEGLAVWGGASAGARFESHPLRRRPGPPALALRPAERRRAGCGDQRAAAARGPKGHSGLDRKFDDETGWCRCAQREPHRAAAGGRQQRRRREPLGLPRRD